MPTGCVVVSNQSRHAPCSSTHSTPSERLPGDGWAARVSGELRTGSQSGAGLRADPFAELSPQQVQIARLAGNGLSNREIGERLFLSPRTIGSHLYRMFPVLGVANRTQLGELVAAADRVGSRPVVGEHAPGSNP
jgi:DNA-binding CsgD family transcriptional regulator